MIQCPKCNATSGIVRVPAHNEPMSTVFPAVFGTMLFLVLPLFPSKFRCKECNSTFRKYTSITWIYLAAIFLLIVAFILALMFFATPTLE
jgi:transposase-like protein